MSEHIALGKAGEALGVRHLKKLKYKIVEQNYRCKFGEIDVVALDRKTVVFVEIKTRSTKEFGSPLNGVTPRKQRKLAKAAMAYLQEHQLFDRDARFDVVAVEVDSGQERIDVIQNAFEISA
ncbi:MAG: YraN family protein [Deltaproteobacteria bacterium]|nr:YraN family protein [Deltaproteobacteria bacterium]